MILNSVDSLVRHRGRLRVWLQGWGCSAAWIAESDGNCLQVSLEGEGADGTWEAQDLLWVPAPSKGTAGSSRPSSSLLAQTRRQGSSDLWEQILTEPWPYSCALQGCRGKALSAAGHQAGHFTDAIL